MELSAYDLALIAGGLGIAGTLVGVLGAYRLSIKLADRQFSHLREISRLEAWRAAAKEFRQAFANDLAVLDSDAAIDGDLKDFLMSAYVARHFHAVALFKHFIPEALRAGLDTEWKRHCYGENSDGSIQSPDDEGLEHEKLLFLHYSVYSGPHRTAEARQCAVNRITKLLTYASET